MRFVVSHEEANTPSTAARNQLSLLDTHSETGGDDGLVKVLLYPFERPFRIFRLLQSASWQHRNNRRSRNDHPAYGTGVGQERWPNASST